MEEILELKQLLLAGDIKAALLIVEELEEMSLNDIINKITSYAIILLVHLIKQEAEKRTTKSWDTSIRNSVREIQRQNQRRKGRGQYLNKEELIEVLDEAYISAIDKASLEVEEGVYRAEELGERVNKIKIINQALSLIVQ